MEERCVPSQVVAFEDPVLSRLCASCVCPGIGELVAACEGLPVSGP